MGVCVLELDFDTCEVLNFICFAICMAIDTHRYTKGSVLNCGGWERQRCLSFGAINFSVVVFTFIFCLAWGSNKNAFSVGLDVHGAEEESDLFEECSCLAELCR